MDIHIIVITFPLATWWSETFNHPSSLKKLTHCPGTHILSFFYYRTSEKPLIRNEPSKRILRQSRAPNALNISNPWLKGYKSTSRGSRRGGGRPKTVFHSSSSGSSVFSSPVIAGIWLKVAALVREMCEIEGVGRGSFWDGEWCWSHNAVRHGRTSPRQQPHTQLLTWPAACPSTMGVLQLNCNWLMGVARCATVNHWGGDSGEAGGHISDGKALGVALGKVCYCIWRLWTQSNDLKVAIL